MYRYSGFNPSVAPGMRPPGLSGQFGGSWHPQFPMAAQGMIRGNSPITAQAQSYGQGMVGSSAPQQGQSAYPVGAQGGSWNPTGSAPITPQSMITGNGVQQAQPSTMAGQGPQNGQAMQAPQSYGAAPPTSPGQPAQGGYWNPGAQPVQQGMINGNGPQAANAASYGGLAAQIGVRR